MKKINDPATDIGVQAEYEGRKVVGRSYHYLTLNGLTLLSLLSVAGYECPIISVAGERMPPTEC